MESIDCNRCGKCKEICPSYKVFMSEAFCPRGRLHLFYLFQEGLVPDSNALKERIFSCLLCGSCFSKCPLGINVPDFMYEARQKITKDSKLYLFKYFSLYPHLAFTGLKILEKISPLSSFLQKIKIFPLKLIDKLRVFDKSHEFTKNLKIFNKIKPKGRVALFLGCSVNYFMPSLREAMIDLLSKANFEIIIPKQSCCGAPLLAAGFKEEILSLALKNINIYKSFQIDGVITPCSTCAHFLSSQYKDLTGENVKILNFADLLENSDNIFQDIKSHLQVYFHVSCHSSNYIKDTNKIMEIIKKQGVSLEKKEGCCGFAGLFSFLFEKESMDILKKKVLEYEKADMLISSCPNCIIQFKYMMENKKVMHYIEFIQKNLLKGE